MKSLILLLIFVGSSITSALPWVDFDRQDASGCSCDAKGTNPDAVSICDPLTKQCDCNCAIEGINCDTCTDMHYNFPECETNPCNCDPNGSTSLICQKSNGQCPCKDNVGGRQCNACEDGFKEHPNCIACACNPEGSNGKSCSNSGQCDCKDNVEGLPCDHCMDNHFGFPDCQACQCHVKGSDGLDCNLHGKCACKEHVTGDKCDQCQAGYVNHPACDQCEAGYFGYPNCQQCTCNENGSKSLTCNQDTGDCECINGNVKSPNCDSCNDGTFGFPQCSGSCDCKDEGSNGCNEIGQCICKDNIEGISCNHCMDNFFGYPECQDCGCNEEGSDGLDCNHNGICTCKPNVSGDKCDQCQDGYINFPNCDQCDTNYHGFPDCKVCTCNPQGSENTTCDKETGECTCKAKVSGASCDTCEEGSYGFPDCQECGCSCQGSLDEGKTCTSQGTCFCKTGYQGDKCELCTEGYHLSGNNLLEECVECACHPDGTNGNMACDASGQCTCSEGHTGKKCEQCKLGFYGFPSCRDCECNLEGSVNSVCNNDGLCSCKDGIDGDRCSRCKRDMFGFPNCQDCGCDPTGSASPECQANGQCQCKEGHSGQKCNIGCPEGWTLVGNKCLQMSTDSRTYFEAAKYCRSIGSSLAEPRSQVENDAMIAFTKTQNKFWREDRFWIGVNDMNQENKFISESNGQEVAFTWWSPGQPDNFNDEDCIEIWFHDNYRWNDNKCDGKNPFVCQKPTNQ